jgi:hypothetical protein
MALMNLKSDLSWYGNKPGFAKKAEDIASRKTNYIYNDDLSVRTKVTGYDNNGFVSQFIPRFSADAFVIDDNSHSFRGTSSRKTQQGAGSKFPIGPKGQVHDFDIPRLGFHLLNRYSDTYNAKSLSGLAATYTKDSPIDDVYNIVKVRDVSYDPFGYASPPYILRGIQRDDNRYPQRWGTGNQIADTVSLALGIPRGGALAFGERAANDVARLAKMMIRPMGLGWVAKQALLHLMNPNTEGVTGLIQQPNNHKFSNPINTLLAAGLSGLGIHPRKHGLLPIGGLGRYGDIHKFRNVVEAASPVRVGSFNRLSRLTTQLYRYYNLPVEPNWNAITGAGGPDSIGGIGITNFSTDSTQGNLDQLLKYPGKDGKGSLSIVDGLGILPAKINAITPRFISRDSISRYSDFVVLSPLVMAWSTGKLSYYADTIGAYKFTRKLPLLVAETAEGRVTQKVRMFQSSTRLDGGNEWKISIPEIPNQFKRSTFNIRTNSTDPVTKEPYTLEELIYTGDYFRSELNPYGETGNSANGYLNRFGNSTLQQFGIDSVFPGIHKSALDYKPGNQYSLRSIRIVNTTSVIGNTSDVPSFTEVPLSDIQTNPNNNTDLYRNADTKYGDEGYDTETNRKSEITTAFSSTGRIGNGDRPLDIKSYLKGDEKEATPTKRLQGMSKNGTTEYTGIQAYKAWGLPQILKVSKGRAPGSTKTLDFTTLKEWKAADSPMAKIGKIGSGDSHRKNRWDKANAANHPINITIGGQIFPAYITDISTKTDQGLLTFKPAGSPVAVLAGASNFSTGVGISFMVAARSKSEFGALWSALKALQGKVKPSASGGVWSPKKCALEVGNFIKISDSYLTSISLSLDNEYPWEIDAGNQNPIYINVDCQFEVIDGDGVYGAKK